jgi:small-conductance mechanosensitive channel
MSTRHYELITDNCAAAFFSESFAKYMFTIGTQLAAISFAIATTVQEFLGSCIFVFVKHPYDVGDMVVITDARMIVEHISLLYSTFRRVDNGRMIQIPNIINNNNWIDNITRSKQMKEQIEISVNAETSFADIEVFKMELITFLSLDENKRDFHHDVDLQITQCKDLKQIDLMVGVSHKVNTFFWTFLCMC